MKKHISYRKRPDRAPTHEELASFLERLLPGSCLLEATPFFSKKNFVFRLDYRMDSRVFSAILKIYSLGNASYEKYSLEKVSAKGIRTPKILASSEGALLLELIDGPNLMELFKNKKEDFTGKKELVLQLAGWCLEFHTRVNSLCMPEFSAFIKNDMNLRNFIYSPEGLVGVDYEESREGVWLEDLGQVCQALIVLPPAFSGESFSFALYFIEEIEKKTGFSIFDKISPYISHRLEFMSNFQPEPSTYLQVAQKIKEEGLISFKF